MNKVPGTLFSPALFLLPPNGNATAWWVVAFLVVLKRVKAQSLYVGASQRPAGVVIRE